ncbi:MAG: hypothetical protein BVN28_08190 [Nitrospira sp. ST-bin4]|nr:MAG: hypothetical protein BVN28_08190 [Nitrospira sp. ST-bin4]
MNIQAMIKRKEWVAWFSTQYGSAYVPEKHLNEFLVKWAGMIHEKEDAGISFEATLSSLSEVEVFWETILGRLQCEILVTIVGSYEAPQALLLPATGFGSFVKKVCQQEAPITFLPLSGLGRVCIDVSPTEAGDGYEVLLSVRGQLEHLIQFAHESVPSGVVFRGN